ncbi:MAG: TIGR03663 family protein [Candidatus Aminicenantes bacterium]|nr:TIGR03663 family protein [Candidatus Aminicenantes bacterium]
MTRSAFGWLFSLIFLAGLVFRVAGLGLRPMHHDEANQALKFGALLEEGEYRYDRTDHHGPSLYYLTWPFARLLGGRDLASQTEKTMRLVPAFFGLGAMLLFLLFLPSFGRPPVLVSALGLVLSPAMVYFSRFYIQETILVFFLAGFLASLWRYVLRPSAGWALAAGFSAGMMYATKETSVIAFAAAAAAFFLTALTDKKINGKRRIGKNGPGSVHPHDDAGQSKTLKPERQKEKQENRARLSHFVFAIGAAFLVIVLLFSSFFQNPKGIIDSIVSFKVYFVRAAETTFHVQPWPYYLKLLAFSRAKGGPLWSEAFLLVLALAGSIASFRRWRDSSPDRSFLKFIFFFTVITTALFSLIPYKTPWNLLSFHLGFILLAGAGAARILAGCRKGGCFAVVLILSAAGFLHLGWQSYGANFIFPADPRNPYVYAQTSKGYAKLIERVEQIAFRHPEGRNMLIKVIAGPYETWPIPWSLRKYERVGYWQKAEEVTLSDRPALVIASAEEAIALEPIISTMYRPEYHELRPNVLLVLFVRDDVESPGEPTIRASTRPSQTRLSNL